MMSLLQSMLSGAFGKPYSHLFIVGDNSGWSTDIDARDTLWFAKTLGIKANIIKRMYLNLPQGVHYTSQFSLLLPIYKKRNRLSVDYYHGKPEQGENFKRCFEALSKNHEQFGRVRVSTKEMEKLIKTTGIDPSKVVRIPIGIDTLLFIPQTVEKKIEARRKLRIPDGATVIGSFQKDGVGWGDGMEPKLIKGPDIFLEVIGKLKDQVPNLWVLLSGPARGFVKKGLDKLGVPYRHEYPRNFHELPEFYDAIDLYMVTSREEGGPKAVLESMAKGVPLVTTKVGQAADLVVHGRNAMMAPIDDSDKLYENVLQILNDSNLEQRIIGNGLATAQENSHQNQLALWRDYFAGLITTN